MCYSNKTVKEAQRNIPSYATVLEHHEYHI